MRCCWIVLLGLLAAACTHVTSIESAPGTTTAGQAGLLDIRALVPDIALDIRYASDRNFVGVPIDGYGAAKCWLRAPAAQALQRVEAALRGRGMRLQVFDCYRPARAVRQFVRWAGDPSDQRSKHRYYPNLDKHVLLGDYIAPVSGHSRGATVDLTVLDCSAGPGRCRALDMGTPFDFFDPRANTDSPQSTPLQRANRALLRSAMEQEGFRNYAMEWWHYTLASAQSPDILDIPIR